VISIFLISAFLNAQYVSEDEIVVLLLI